jgi:glycosyltransferase involved in cell wall biosynthesis
MRLWLLTQSLVERPGGIATHLRLLQQGLHFNGHEALILSADAVPRFLSRTLISVPFRCVNLFRQGTGIEYAIRMHSRLLYRRMRRRVEWGAGPEVFACNDIASVLAAREVRDRFCPRAAILLTVHSHYTYEKVGQGWMAPGSRGERRILELERRAMLAADALIAVSEKMRNHIIALIGPTIRPITMLHNAIDVDRFAPPISERQKERSRRALGLPENVAMLLQAGHLLEIKGPHIAVEAARILRDQGELFVLAFVGDGPMRSRLENFVKENRLREQVRFLGAIDHDRMPTVYRAADILLMPSIPSYRAEESFGLSAIEALSCGLPVVASRSGGLCETVRDGENGFLVEPGDPYELAEMTAGLLADEENRRQMGQEGRDYAVSHHDHVAHARYFALAAESAFSPQGDAAVVRMAA